MSSNNIQHFNKKTIEEKLKSRCESLLTLINKIRNRTLDNLEPDKGAGSMFIVEGTSRLSGVIIDLLESCADSIKNGNNDQKENVDLKIATTLLRIFNQFCSSDN